MSNTVTATQVSQVLEDYKIHLTGASEEDTSIQETPRVVNPPNWTTDRRRVPEYRPINRNLNMEERPNGVVLPETIFISIMFTGVFTEAVSSIRIQPQHGY